MNSSQAKIAYTNAAANVSKTRQVVMLYDGLIRMVQQVKTAMENNEIEKRYNLLQQACNVILGLQASLDFERGGEIAQLMDKYYSSIDARLISLHRRQDIAVADQVVKELKMMRDAWVEVDRQASSGEFEEKKEMMELTPSAAKIESISCSI